MLGELDDLQMWSEIGIADLFALTPINLSDAQGLDAEGFGLVFIEAAALGVPSIASVFGGCRDAIQEGRTGLLVDPLTPSEAAGTIDAFLDAQSGRGAVAEDCRRLAREDFRWADRAAIFTTAYAQAAQPLSVSPK
jgi:phosphatidylinositol alpha-1,6-mannosyltransferase